MGPSPPAPAHTSNPSQLKKLAETGVSQTELQQILNLLFIVHYRHRHLPLYVVPPPSFQWQNQSFAGPSQPMPPTAPYQPNQPHLSGSNVANIKMESLPATLPPSVPALPDINKLLSLIKASVVSARPTPNNSTPHGAGASREKRPPSLERIDLTREAKRQYRTAILAQKVKLTSCDIIRSVDNPSSRWPCMLTFDLRTRPQIVDFLYH